MRVTARRSLLIAALGVLWCGAILVAADPRPTGPETEKRFPPLVVPEGFKATLFACDPLIEYPSAIAVGPKERPGAIFVAVDYMTGLGTEIVRRDEIRLVEDTDGDGYADKATVYADGFNSIMGMTFHGGTVYVMHSPLLTALRDTDGDGKADERRDLLTGLGLPPEENDVRLHCANGIAAGHDGWLYLAIGDHGCDVPRAEGDRLVYHGGGILRCRPDGRDLHLFASGLRNIYDVALDDELNVYVRDNENDGGDYKIRVCYSFHGADHGYPYLYYEHPDEALQPLADLGLGSSAGGAAYLERQFPAEYHGSLFFCEWGKSVVRYHPQRTGSGFGPLPETEFASGAPNDPYGFKPTDLIVDRDGSLVVADWCDGQRPKRGRGRIYRIQSVAGTFRVPSAGNGPRNVPATNWITQLNSDSHYARVEAQDAISARGAEGLKELRNALAAKDRLTVSARMHAVWFLARDGSDTSRKRLFDLAASDPDPRVQVQAIRALADLHDPVLASHRLDAPPADAAIGARLASLAKDKDQRVVLEIVVTLGRLRWSGAPQWLGITLTEQKPIEPILAHAAMQALRQSNNWPAVLKLLDLDDREPVRVIALRAVAGRFDPEVIDGLIARLADGDAAQRREYAGLLTRVCQQPGPWTYWGYRPPPRPPATVAWDRTAAIEEALDRILADVDVAGRLSVLRRMQREQISPRLKTLENWLETERSADAVAAILESLDQQPAQQRQAALVSVVKEREHALAGRLRALALVAGDDGPPESLLLELAATIEDGPVLADVLRRLTSSPRPEIGALLAAKLGSPTAEVRASALTALAGRGASDLGGWIKGLLADRDAGVRRAAAEAAGQLKIASASEPLLALAADADPHVRRASLDSLRLLREPRAVPLAVAALRDHPTQDAALTCVAEMGGPRQAEAVIALTRTDSSEAVALPAARALAQWSREEGVSPTERQEMERAILELQGRSGLLVHWCISGPLKSESIDAARKLLLAFPPSADSLAEFARWPSALAQGVECRVPLPAAVDSEQTWLAFADVVVSEANAAQFLAGAGGKWQVWLNGQPALERASVKPFQADADHFTGNLSAGFNRIVIQLTASGDGAAFQMRFRRKSSTAQIEQFVQAALTRTGDIERGRKLFLDAAKTQCLKCHRLGNDGERIGPELTGIGQRFSRIHIVESILEPSRTVTPGFQTLLVRMADGQTISGIKLAEDERTLTLADQKGDKHALAKAEIEAQQSRSQSTMPDNLAQQLTADQFVDLVTFLVAQKLARSPEPAAGP